MSLTLTIGNVPALENGQPTRMTLDRHGAIIGRSPHVDWSLPDPRKYISSTHCEIDYREGGYTLTDKSTNGTFINGAQDRLASPHRIRDGDLILIGQYELRAKLEGADLAAAGAAAAAPAWGGWDAHAGGGPAAAADPAAWDRPAPQPAISGLGAMSQNWAAPAVQPASTWGEAPPPPAAPASGWSSPVAAAPAPPTADDVWGKLAAGNEVDWSRGGFAAAPPNSPGPTAGVLGLGGGSQPADDPFGLNRAEPPQAQPVAGGWRAAAEESASLDWGAPARTRPPEAQPPPAAPPAAPPPIVGVNGGGEWSAFLSGAGLAPGDLKSAPGAALTEAGAALKRLIAGLVVMLEARARAKAQLGAQGTSLEFDGNNPLKFARTPEKALAQLLNPPERGFMTAERAVEDAFLDLQAHQMATLAAMQGALAATLKRFSPESIRSRAEHRGILAKILPSARDAALWQDYEREFEGVAKGSDEAFMDVFAKEFRQAYDDTAARMKAKR